MSVFTVGTDTATEGQMMVVAGWRSLFGQRLKKKGRSGKERFKNRSIVGSYYFESLLY